MALQFDNSGVGTITLASSGSTNYTLTFPSAGGTASQVLQTDASGNLSWVTASPTSISQFTFALNNTGVNSTINVVSMTSTVATASGSFIIQPKGASGFIAFSIPDGTTTGGDTRGVGAVDYCLPGSRRTSADVASGAYSTLLAYNSKADGDYATVIAGQNNATAGGGGHQVCIGSSNVNTMGAYSTVAGVNYWNGNAQYAIAMCGNAPYSTVAYSWTLGGYGGDSYNNVNSYGRTQVIRACYNAITTNATIAYLTTKGSVSNAQLTTSDKVITSWAGGIFGVEVKLTVNSGSGTNAAAYECYALFKYTSGTSTISIVGTPTITQLYQDAALAGIAVTMGVDNLTTKTFWIGVTGLAGTTIGWNAWVSATCNCPVGA